MAEASILRRDDVDGIARVATAAFSLTLAPAAARCILRGAPAVAEAAGAAFAVALPTRPCMAAASGPRAALWLGPDEWLLIAEGEEPAAMMAHLEAALARTAHSLVDVSHRQVALVAQGPRAARVLSAGCPLDLHPAAFPVGRAVRTVLAKAEIVLWRARAERFRIEVWRSFAPYASAYLSEAARGAPEV